MRPRREASEGPPWVARLSEVVRTVASGELPEGASLAARERFLASCARARRWRPRRVPRRSWRGAGFLAVGAAAAQLFHATSVASGTARRSGNGYVTGASGACPTMRLVGGSSVQLAPGSRARVGDHEAERARAVLFLEAGRATLRGPSGPSGASGTERSRRDVRVEAGPYAVTSRDAQFDVSWSGEAIEVRVAAGAVTVEGPIVSHGLTLHEDQTFVACEAAEEHQCF
jgi:ferric-dicitrate binding protein FerR (iron transport regulator)